VPQVSLLRPGRLRTPSIRYPRASQPSSGAACLRLRLRSVFLSPSAEERAAFGIGIRGGHITANSFDLFGETVQKVLPDGTLTETRNYDTAGNLTSLTHFNGVTTTYTYDSLNRLLTRTTPGEQRSALPTRHRQVPHLNRRRRNGELHLRLAGPAHHQGHARGNVELHL